MEFIVNNPGELEAVAKAILERVEEPVVITLTGDLGAGKTTLVQAFCKVLGSFRNLSKL